MTSTTQFKIIITTINFRGRLMENLLIPTRHGANKSKAMRIAKPLLFTIRDRKSATPSSAQWQRMGETLLQGDPVADKLASWIQGDGSEGSGKGAYAQFEKALETGNFDDENLPEPLRNFFQSLSNTRSEEHTSELQSRPHLV